MRNIPLDIGVIHFVGIGGIGMSGIAEILHELGYAVQGSDISDNANVQRLREKGINVFVPHDRKNVFDSEGHKVRAVVVSSAIKNDNPELIAARENKIPVVRRAEMLAELMRLKWAVAIAGTHGKTTTTSLVGAMLEEGGFDPTVVNGGIINRYGTNVRLGKSEWMVVEADESDGTFTRLPATVGVITNIDPEHMEHYGTFENLRLAFKRFVENLPFYGFAALCSDHPEVQALIPELTDRRVLTYGMNPQADVRAQNLRFNDKGCKFDVEISRTINEKGDLTIQDVFLPMFGEHNVLNALAAITIAWELEIAVPVIRKALEDFAGVKRRFTKTGEVDGITIIDDYGHHPVEIEAVLKAGRRALEQSKGRLIAVVQPHRYSRLQSLFDEFCTCFNDADTVIVADIYEAGEQPIEGVDKASLAAGIIAHGHRSVQELDKPQSLAKIVSEIAESGDFVICLGAGDITKWAYALPEELGSLRQKKRA
jgi:UDP-N-acetylmuramate--alanine ligase